MIVKLPMMLREGEGAGGTPAWLASVPVELRDNPSLKTVPDVPTLAKNYVSAQQMIGSRVPVPEEGWTPDQWNQFYNKVGRPADPEKYTMPDMKLEEGVSLDGEKLKGLRAKVHGLGLTDRQFKGIMEVYLGSINEGVKGASTAAQTERDAAMGALKTEWSDKFDTNLDIAKSVLRKFAPADSKLYDYLETSKLGNNVEFVKFLHTLGQGMLEDTTRGGELGSGMQITDATRALQEIDRLKMDPEFIKAMNDAQNVGHQSAVNRWVNLHSVAYPGKSA